MPAVALTTQPATTALVAPVKRHLAFVPIASIVGAKGFPTKKFAESVRKDEVIQPILLSGNPQDELPVYTVVDGRRRLEAARLAGHTQVPALIFEIKDDAIAYMTVIANLQRSRDVASELRAVRALAMQGMTSDDLEATLGLYKRDFKKLVLLLNLCQPAIDLLDEQKVSPSTAAVIASLSEAQQKELLAAAGDDKVTLAAAKAFKKSKVFTAAQLSFLSVELPAVTI